MSPLSAARSSSARSRRSRSLAVSRSSISSSVSCSRGAVLTSSGGQAMSTETLSSTAPVEIDIRGVSKWFGSNQVLKKVWTDVRRGEAVVIIGPSGSGKTTLLRCINLLEQFQDGEICIAGEAMGYQVDPATQQR